MWSASRRIGIAALAAAWCGLAGACGFEPMYGEHRGQAVQAELQTVSIASIPNRAGQEMRRYLLDRIHNGDQTPRPLYQLEISLIEQRQFYGIQRDTSATYARFVLTGYYLLRDVKSGQAVLSGNTSAYSSYNIAADPFNSIVAENDARDRAVRTLGDDLIARVSIYLRNPTPPAAAKSG
jgi:LPS-assembly lipoprotein